MNSLFFCIALIVSLATTPGEQRGGMQLCFEKWGCEAKKQKQQRLADEEAMKGVERHQICERELAKEIGEAQMQH